MTIGKRTNVISEAEAVASVSLTGMRSAIEQHYGERCPDHEPCCVVCQAWEAFDTLCRLFDLDPNEGESSRSIIEAAAMEV